MIICKIGFYQKENVMPFPKLMVDADGMIVLFKHDHCGTVIYEGNNKSHKIGNYYASFKMENFWDLQTGIYLENVKINS